MRKIFFYTVIFIMSISSVFSLSIFELPKTLSNNSPSLKKKELDIKGKTIDIKNQPFEYFPDLSLNYKTTINPKSLNSDFSHSHSFGLDTSFVVFDSGNRIFNHLIERVEYKNIFLEYKILFQNTLIIGVENYINALKAKMNYLSAVSNEVISKSEYEYILSKRIQGEASELDVINAKAEYDNSIYLARSKKIDYDNAISKLRRVLKVEEVQIEAITNVSYEAIPYSNCERIFLGKAGAFLEYEKISNNLKMLSLQKKKAIRERFIPSLDINFGVDWLDVSYSSYSGATNDFLDMSLSFRVSLPIFEKNTYLNAIRKLNLRIEQGESDAEELLLDRLSDLKELVSEHNNKITLVPILERRIESAKKNYDKIRQSYGMGVSSLLDMQESEKRYRDALNDMIFLKYDILLLKVRLGRFLGDTFFFIR